MNVRFKRIPLILSIAVALSSASTSAKELPGGVREPSSAGNLQGGQGGGCKGPACNEKGSTPTGVKNVSPPKPSRPQLPCHLRGQYGYGPICPPGGSVGGGNKGTKCQPNGEGCGKQF